MYKIRETDKIVTGKRIRASEETIKKKKITKVESDREENTRIHIIENETQLTPPHT